MIKGAFSLIELLVVVAIIAILAAIAVPIYSRYAMSAKAAGAVTLMESLVNASVKLQSTNGYFANAYNLGLNPSLNNQNATQAIATALNPYILASSTSITATDWNQNDSSYCLGKYGMIRINLDPAKLNLPNTYTYFQIECDLWNSKGVITKFCWYTYGGAGFVGTGNIIPGWLAATDPSSTNIISTRNAMPSYQNMNCPT